MLPINFPQANSKFDSLPGLVPLYQGIIKGMPVFISKWSFSKEDIDSILKNNELWVVSVGIKFQPITLYTNSPFQEELFEKEIYPKYFLKLEHNELVIEVHSYKKPSNEKYTTKHKGFLSREEFLQDLERWKSTIKTYKTVIELLSSLLFKLKDYTVNDLVIGIEITEEDFRAYKSRD